MSGKKKKAKTKPRTPKKPTTIIGRLGSVNPSILRGGTHEAAVRKGSRSTLERRDVGEQLDDQEPTD